MRRMLLMIVLLAAVIPGAVGAQQEPEPRFNVEPKAGPPGTRFAFMATGFLAYEDIGVWLNDPDGRPVTARREALNPATGYGRADWFWRAPGGIRPGAWTMIARGKQSGVQRLIPFTILPGPTPGDPSTPGGTAPGGDWNLEPKGGPPGTRFAFVAFGFRARERVAVWLNTPDGQPLPAEVERLGRATSAGRVDWIWQAPSYFRPGWWHMVARGTDSGVQYIIPFEIR